MSNGYAIVAIVRSPGICPGFPHDDAWLGLFPKALGSISMKNEV
jgi:hypothetical protein